MNGLLAMIWLAFMTCAIPALAEDVADRECTVHLSHADFRSSPRLNTFEKTQDGNMILDAEVLLQKGLLTRGAQVWILYRSSRSGSWRKETPVYCTEYPASSYPRHDMGACWFVITRDTISEPGQHFEFIPAATLSGINYFDHNGQAEDRNYQWTGSPLWGSRCQN